MVIRLIVLFVFCILIKDTSLFGEELSSGEEAKIVPQKFLGSWTALSRGQMAKFGDLALSQNQIEFSKKGLFSFEIIELGDDQVYLQFDRKVDSGVFMRIGPIKKHQWLADHYQMEVAYYETKESLLRSEAGWEGSSSWGAYLKKVEIAE